MKGVSSPCLDKLMNHRNSLSFSQIPLPESNTLPQRPTSSREEGEGGGEGPFHI